MKKSSKRLIISSEALNDKGFRVRTSGIDLSLFNNNPILLWMHQRPKGERRDEVLPLGYWEDVKLEGTTLSGVPVFDEGDTFAMDIYRKVENGTIRMASAGLLPGMFENISDELWLTQSQLREASLVDAGSNPEALAVQLYNEEGQTVTLNQAREKFDPSNIKPMTKIKLSAAAGKLLKLDQGAEMDATVVMERLVNLATEQATQIQTLSTAKGEVETELANLKEEKATIELTALVDKAVEDRKITADEKPHYLKLGKVDLASVKSLLDSKPSQKSVTETLSGKTGNATEADELLKLSWDELDKTGQLAALKDANPEGFKEKYKAKFKKEYAE